MVTYWKHLSRFLYLGPKLSKLTVKERTCVNIKGFTQNVSHVLESVVRQQLLKCCYLCSG